jgi:hypothetical protein
MKRLTPRVSCMAAGHDDSSVIIQSQPVLYRIPFGWMYHEADVDGSSRE